MMQRTVRNGGRRNSERQWRGAVAFARGRMGEETVIATYADLGYRLLAQRWRGRAGEIDLIFRGVDGIVFVEVKAASTHDVAAMRLSRRQMDRICLSACEFIADLPGGQLTEMRFDAALVDDLGRVEILQAAFGMN